MSKEELIEMQAIVYGNVQGVGFRATARNVARKWNLKGTARNLPDGTVEIYILGKKDHIDLFFQILKENVYPGYISKIELRQMSTIHPFEDFQILH